MKKIISFIILLTFFSLNNLTFIYANNDELNVSQTSTINTLDKLEDKVISILDKVDDKIKDEEQKDKIQEKQEEIEQLIKETKKDIESETNKGELKKILDETIKTITLKAVAGVTSSTDASENITAQIDIPKKDINKAEDTLMNSIETKDGYTLMLKTKQTEEDVISLLKKYDENIKIDKLFEEEGYNYFDLTISEDSLLRKELLENVDNLEIPNSLLGIEVIKPELLKIGEITENNSYTGEEIEKLRGIKKYNLTKYQDIIKSKTTKKIKVGIIDTGISYNHPDLKGLISNEVAGYDFVNEDNDPLDDQGHGTHVSGTIAGAINGEGVFGVNPNVELIGLKICDSSGFCPTYGVYRAINYAKENNIDVLNMSLGAKGNVETSTICQAIKDVTEAGIIVVAASGNSNTNTSTFVPGGCMEAITVAAVDENLTRASFSNYGDKVDVAAPGVGIYSTYLNNSYKSLNGTSMATPHIVGIVSILKTLNPSLKTSNIKEIFKNNAIPVNTESNKKIASFVDVDKMIKGFGIVVENKQEEIKKTDEKEIVGNTGNTVSEVKKDELIVKEPIKNVVIENNNNVPEINTKTPKEEGLQDISVVDESIGLVIQNDNEKVEINSAEDESRSIESDGITNEKETLNLNGNDNNIGTGEEDKVEINSAEDEVINELNEETENSEDTGEDTAIQNSYTCSFNIGGSCSLSLTKANTYTYTVSQAGYLTYSATSSQVTIYGNKAGTTNFYIKSGTKTIHTIVITVTDPIKALKATMGTTVLQNGSSTNVSITDGNGGYSVNSSNTYVAQVSGSNTSWTITGKSIGNATITVKDSKGKSGTWNLSVTARNLILDKYSLSIDKGYYGYFNISDGNGGYIFSKSSTNLGIYYGNKTNEYKLYSNIAGNYTVQVKDNQGKVVSLSVKILSPLLIDKSNISLYNTENGTFNVTSGNGGYSAISSNSSVATVSLNGTTGTITTKGAGSTTITVTDSSGKSISLSIIVKGLIIDLKATKILADFNSKANSTLLAIGFSSGPSIANAGDEEYQGDDNEEQQQDTVDENNNKEENNIEETNEDDSVEINSVSDASRCELGRTGKYWVRPYNAVCVDNNTTEAWKCKSGYVDLFAIDGTNSCVSKNYLLYRKTIKDKISLYVNISRTKTGTIPQSVINDTINTFGKLREECNANAGDDLHKSVCNVAYDEFINILDKQTNPQVKDYVDLKSIYNALILMSNNGWWGDGYADEYKGKSRANIESQAKIFAEKMFNYKMNYDLNFKNNYNIEVTRELTNGGAKADVEKGIKEGIIEGTKDYLMQYYDLYNTLKGIELKDIYNGVDSVWTFLKNPIENATNIITSAKQILIKTYTKLISLTGYAYAKGGSYIGTSLSLIIADPYGKLAKSAKYLEYISKIDNFIDVLNLKITKLGTIYISKFNTLVDKLILNFDKTKREFIMGRIGMMDDGVTKSNLNNIDGFINSFKDGKYPMLKGQDLNGEVYGLIFNNGKIRFSNGFSLDSKNINYILFKENGNYRLVFGQNHSYLSQGKNVEFAGSIKFTSNGEINYIDNGSGHYKPSFSDKDGISNVVNSFNKRFGISLSTNIFKEYNY